MTLLACACDELGDTDQASTLIDLLSPYEGRHLVMSGFGAYWGPADLALGGLAATLGRRGAAERYLKHALEMCEAVGTPGWKARTQLRLAQLLFEQDRDRARRLLDESVTTAERIGMAGLASRVHSLL